MEIVEASAASVSPGPAEWFTGAVWLEQVAPPKEFTRLRGLRVSFSAGARTAWHTHPHGQTLLVLQGVARVQSEGGPVRELGAGDSVTFEPGERHWHGAAPDRPMVHLALQQADDTGDTTSWEQHVTDAEYGA